MEGNDDPDCRRAFPWDEARWDRDVLDWFRRAIRLRHNYPALRRGRYLRLDAGDEHNVLAFARQLESDTLIVVINLGPGTFDVDVPVAGLLADGILLQDLWGGGAARVDDGCIRGKVVASHAAAVFGGESKLVDK